MKDTNRTQLDETCLIEMPPARVPSLDELSDDAALMYEAAEGGGFALKASAIAAIAASNQQIRDLWAEHLLELEKLDRRIIEKDAVIEKLAKQNEVTKAVAAAGVPVQFRRAAIAQLLADLTFVLEPRDELPPRVKARTDFGDVQVRDAVEQWLAGEGAAFAPKPTVTDGPYSQQLRKFLH